MSSADQVRVPAEARFLPAAARAVAAPLFGPFALRHLLAVAALVLGCWALLSVVADPARADAGTPGRQHGPAASEHGAGHARTPARPPADTPADPEAAQPQAAADGADTPAAPAAATPQPPAEPPADAPPSADPGSSPAEPVEAEPAATPEVHVVPAAVPRVVLPAVPAERHIAPLRYRAPSPTAVAPARTSGDAHHAPSADPPIRQPLAPTPAPVQPVPADSGGGTAMHGGSAPPVAALFVMGDPVLPVVGWCALHPPDTARVIHGTDDPGSRPG